MVNALLFAAFLLLQEAFACPIMPICPAVLTQPNMISANSEYLLKSALGSLENDVGLLNVSYFAANLSLKYCKPQRRPFSYICTAEISNFDVKWVCRAGQFFVLFAYCFFPSEWISTTCTCEFTFVYVNFRRTLSNSQHLSEKRWNTSTHESTGVEWAFSRNYGVHPKIFENGFEGCNEVWNSAKKTGLAHEITDWLKAADIEVFSP